MRKFPNKNLQYATAGFTLLELLISLTIVGIILVIIFGSLRIGSRAWEKGEADVEAQQRERVVLELIKRQIASICVRNIKIGDKEPYLFKGDQRSMEFMSSLPVTPTPVTGTVYVKYVVKDTHEQGNALGIYEKDVVSMVSGGIPDEPDDSDFYALIPHARRVGFEFLKKNEDGNGDPEWQGTWDPDLDAGLPMAVSMTFQRDKDTPPLRVIVQIHPEARQ